MNFATLKKCNLCLALLFLLTLAAESVSTAQSLPNPVLVFRGTEHVQEGGKQWTRYKYDIDNFASYPNELFAAAPDLPPCGKNTKAARTWVDIYDDKGKRLNGFCAFGKHDDLRGIWFALESEALPPSWIYIELTDRKTNTKYKSNLAETTQ